MNLGRKDDISPMQENVVLSDSEGESERAPPPPSRSLSSFLCFFRYRMTPPPSALSQLIRISLRPSVRPSGRHLAS